MLLWGGLTLKDGKAHPPDPHPGPSLDKAGPPPPVLAAMLVNRHIVGDFLWIAWRGRTSRAVLCSPSTGGARWHRAAALTFLCSTSAVPVPGRSDEDPSRRPSPTCGPELKVTAVIPYALSPYLPHSFYFTAFIFWGTLCRTKPSLLCSASARAVLLRPHPSPFSVSSHAELPGRPDRSARTAFPARSRGAAAGPCRAVGPAGGRGRPALSAGLCCAGGAALSLRERWRKAVRVGVLQDFGAPPPSSRSVPPPGERDPKAALPAALREGIGTGKRREGNFGRLRAAEPAV